MHTRPRTIERNLAGPNAVSPANADNVKEFCLLALNAPHGGFAIDGRARRRSGLGSLKGATVALQFLTSQSNRGLAFHQS